MNPKMTEARHYLVTIQIDKRIKAEHAGIFDGDLQAFTRWIKAKLGFKLDEIPPHRFVKELEWYFRYFLNDIRDIARVMETADPSRHHIYLTWIGERRQLLREIVAVNPFRHADLIDARVDAILAEFKTSAETARRRQEAIQAMESQIELSARRWAELEASRTNKKD